MLPGNVIGSNENSENSETIINNPDPEPSPPSTVESIGWKNMTLIKLQKTWSYSDRIAGTITIAWILFSLWGVGYALSKWTIPMDSTLFAILLLLTTTLAGGLLMKIIRLPPLLGMLLVGLIWRNWNTTNVDVAGQISTTWSVLFRNLATVIILLRGGYGLNHIILKANWPVILALGFFPCLIESACWAVGAHFLLGMSWLWGFLTGFVISAASAAVVIPKMLEFQNAGLGKEKGIPTIAIASTSIDNVTAMAAFGILHEFIFQKGNLLHNLSNIPIQILVGVGFGGIWGMILTCFPRKAIRTGHLIGGRMCLLLSGGIIAIFGGSALGYSGAGPFGCVILAFIANVSWRRQSGWGNPQQLNPIADMLGGLWIFLEALLFGLIGTQIDINKLNPQLIGYGILVLLVALSVRCIASFLSVMRAGLTLKEQLFVAVTWMPKATVQAALGPVALETARRLEAGPVVEQLASDVLTLAALSILITAPIGALAIQLSGPRLLRPQVTEPSGPTIAETETPFIS